MDIWALERYFIKEISSSLWYLDLNYNKSFLEYVGEDQEKLYISRGI